MAWQCSISGVISVLVTGMSQKCKLRRQPLTSISLACLETLVTTSTLSCFLRPRVQYLASVFHGCATTQILLHCLPARKRTGLAATNVWPSLLLSKWRRSDTRSPLWEPRRRLLFTWLHLSVQWSLLNQGGRVLRAPLMYVSRMDQLQVS